ncbi:uncharacterized protein A1O5_07933, partial [Cladophialophora psammophila CBS 110553]
ETPKKVRGEDHPDTLMAMGILAVIMHRQQRKEEVLKLLAKCAQAQRRALGADHPDTYFSSRKLA